MNLILTALLVFGQSPKVEIPEIIKGEPNSFITVLPTTNGKSVKYVYLDKGLNVFPSSLLSNPIATVVTAPKGKYRLLAYTALADVPSDPAICVINVGNVPDAAPFGPYIPKPDVPDDNKPDNNKPDDNKPAPKDPLEEALKGIWGGLSSNDKQAAAKAAKLAELYREGARAALDTSTDPQTGNLRYMTVGDVYTKINTLAKGVLTNDDLYDVRDRLRAEMNSVLPRDAKAPLTDEVRNKLAREFSRYSNILEKLK
jgi:hypothetical protein